MKKRGIYLLLALLFVVVALCVIQRGKAVPSIAIVGYSDSDSLVWNNAASSLGVDLETVSLDRLTTISLSKYDVLLLRTIGWIPSQEQQKVLEKYRKHGKIVALPLSLDRSLHESNVSKDLAEKIQTYLDYLTENNAQSILKIMTNTFCSTDLPIPSPEILPEFGFFYLDKRIVPSLKAFEKQCRDEGHHLSPNAPRVALIGSFLDPVKEQDRKPQDEFIEKLSQKGVNVYPIYGFKNNPELLTDVKPDLVVYFPRGRVLPNDKGRTLLTKLNVPVLSAVHLSSTEKEWRSEPVGMTGSYYALATALPELDGVIEPTPISTKDPNVQGLVFRKSLSERIDSLVERIDKWLILKRKQNKDKKVAVFYYKAPGNAALTAQSLEVTDSLYNFLKTLRSEGYDLGEHFPESKEALEQLIMTKGKTIGQWAIGALETFVQKGEPEMIPATVYRSWFQKYIPEERQKEVLKYWGLVPGKYMVFEKDDVPYMLISRIQLGNIVLLPQPTVEVAGKEVHSANHDDINSVHGTHKAPPHFYIGAYLWVEHEFNADAIIHFGTHGSLEFTPGKSAMMSENCWPDILIGDAPHIYLYSINNIGEALLAKRRTRAVLVSHLTSPFRKGELYGDLALLDNKLHDYEQTEDPLLKNEYLHSIFELTRKTGILADLASDTHYRFFSDSSLAKEGVPARTTITPQQLEELHRYLHQLNEATVTNGLHVLGRPWTDAQIHETAQLMVGDTAQNEMNLRESTRSELTGLTNTLSGKFIIPSTGGDVIINSSSAPTGRNLAGTNIEITPGKEVEQVALRMTDELLSEYQSSHHGHYPRRIALTLWGGEYIRTGGVAVAQAFYLLGVRPVRDSKGNIQSTEIIPSEELKRPRIDLLVQTSGQFRDAVGSRIELLDKAVRMVSELPKEKYPNYIKENTEYIGNTLRKNGHSADEVNEWKTARIFGSPNAVHYGTGIMHLIERGDQWNSETEIANQYLANMSGIYRNGTVWGKPVSKLLEANLQGTDLMLQTRSSNTWGPVKLDHVYEFNTLALAIRQKTKIDPEVWFGDFRSPAKPKNATAKSAIREELRTTLWNPGYLHHLQKEGASAAASLSETVRNLYGWNVVQPKTIDAELWQETSATLIDDKYNLGIKKWFESKNPYALQDMTAVMLETIRKGYWKPSKETIEKISNVHAELVRDYGAACSYDTCANGELHRFLGAMLAPSLKSEYQNKLNSVLRSSKPLPQVKGIELEEKKEEQLENKEVSPPRSNRLTIVLILLFVFLVVSTGYYTAKNK